MQVQARKGKSLLKSQSGSGHAGSGILAWGGNRRARTRSHRSRRPMLQNLPWAPLSGSQVDVWELHLIIYHRGECVSFRAGTLPLGSVFIRCLNLRYRELCPPGCGVKEMRPRAWCFAPASPTQCLENTVWCVARPRSTSEDPQGDFGLGTVL